MIFHNMFRFPFAISVLILLCTSSFGSEAAKEAKPPVAIDSVQIKLADSLAKLPKKDLARYYRKKHNFTEFVATLLLSQSQFDNWSAGGDNTFTGRSTVLFRHIYKKDKFSIENRFNARYGLSVIDTLPYKNEDEFVYNMQSKWSIKHNWSYAGVINLRSQFSKGYKSRTDKTLVSNLMAPGFLDVSLGFNYKRAKSPFNITIAPLTGSLLLVLSEELSKKGINGVEKGERTKGDIGSSLRVEFDKTFYKSMFRYQANFYSFSNYTKTPTARFENTLQIRPVKFLTTTLFGMLYYDKEADTPKKSKIQINYSISIGLVYSFKSK